MSITVTKILMPIAVYDETEVYPGTLTLKVYEGNPDETLGSLLATKTINVSTLTALAEEPETGATWEDLALSEEDWAVFTLDAPISIDTNCVAILSAASTDSDEIFYFGQWIDPVGIIPSWGYTVNENSNLPAIDSGTYGPNEWYQTYQRLFGCALYNDTVQVGNLSIIEEDSVYLFSGGEGQLPDITDFNFGYPLTFASSQLPAAPAKADTPYPANTATEINPYTTQLSWQCETDEDEIDGYYLYFDEGTGTLPVLPTKTVKSPYALLGYSLKTATTYKWRVDSFNSYGTTTGDEWTFTTAATVQGRQITQEKVWLSSVDDYENFEEGEKDADSYSLAVPTTNTTLWIKALNDLLVGTTGDEWKIGTNKIDTPLTPTNSNVKPQTKYGSKNVQAIKVNKAILFIDFVGRKIREIALDPTGNEGEYVAPDLTSLAEHITLSGIVWYAHQRNPDSILWFGLDDGSLRTMTYDREQNVIACAKHPIDGYVQSGCVTPGTNEDEVWISVKRTINESDVIYIEKFASRTFTDIEDCFFVDGGLTVENSPASSTIAGLDHLEGETVTGLVDGVVMDDAVVTGGEITAKVNGVETAVSKAQVGLAYTYKLEPMRPDISGQGGTSHSSLVKVPEMGISFLNTAGAKYGVSDDKLYSIDFDDLRWKNNSDITGLFTGDVVVSVDGGFTLDNNLIISGSDPLPCTVRCLVPKLEVTGR